MIYSVNAAEMAARVNPFALAKYALETGWTEVKVRKENIRVFQKEEGADFHELILPTDRRLSDFSMAMSRCVQELADAEHKAARQVLLYLLNPDSDILKVRLERTDLSAGDILIDDAVALYESTKKTAAFSCAGRFQSGCFSPGKAGHKSGRVCFKLQIRTD